MDKFIHLENLKHYQNLLLRTIDETERQQILKLIEEEEKKFKKLFLAAGRHDQDCWCISKSEGLAS